MSVRITVGSGDVRRRRGNARPLPLSPTLGPPKRSEQEVAERRRSQARQLSHLPCAGSSQTKRTYVCSLASARRLSTARALWPRAMSWFVRTATALETASRTVEASRVQAPVASATNGLNRTPLGGCVQVSFLGVGVGSRGSQRHLSSFQALKAGQIDVGWTPCSNASLLGPLGKEQSFRLQALPWLPSCTMHHCVRSPPPVQVLARKE